jgi:predicted nucleic acid-binding protein
LWRQVLAAGQTYLLARNMSDASVECGEGCFPLVPDLVFDTTFFIDLRRGRSQGAQAIWDDILNREIAGAYSPITAYELWVGARFNRDEEAFYVSMFAVLEEIPLRTTSARTAGIWLRGMPGVTEHVIRDALIAATADGATAAVCTMNQRDFQLFPVQVRTY